ncbi:MAG: FkbM family methyltransferase [Holosporaceae bacterium]|jgi:FkbM family methyltransferase|nr:FkbM family methyltransferase [Holosporaceae bacterium]
MANEKKSFFARNITVATAIITACFLFITSYFIEKSQTIANIIPTLRGEVPLENGFAITITKKGYPILIKKDDPIVGRKLRFTGEVNSLFSEVAFLLAQTNDVIAEVGAHFGYNAVTIGKKIKGTGKYYAFEPNHTALSCLRKSVVLNNLEEVVNLKNVAICDGKKRMTIDDCLSAVKTRDGKYATFRTISVEGDSIDEELFAEPKPISLLLVDLPGLEFPIIRGADRTLAKSDDIKILISFSLTESSKNCDVKSELSKLEEQGFKFYIAKNAYTYERTETSDILNLKEAVIIITKKELK